MGRPRMRPIKPEIWQSQDFLSLNALGRLIFLGLVTVADDDGRIKASPRHVQVLFGLENPEVVPERDSNPSRAHKKLAETVTDQLARMQAQGMIQLYQVTGQVFISLSNWSKHQRVSHYKPSDYPAPEEATDQSVLPFLRSSPESVNSPARGGRDRDRDSGSGSGSARAREVAVQLVYDAWAGSLPAGTVRTLTAERRKKIQARLERYAPDQLAAAVSTGWQLDAKRWPERVNQNDVAILLRSDEQAEKFINLALNGIPPAPREQTVGERWLERQEGVGGSR